MSDNSSSRSSGSPLSPVSASPSRNNSRIGLQSSINEKNNQSIHNIYTMRSNMSLHSYNEADYEYEHDDDDVNNKINRSSWKKKTLSSSSTRKKINTPRGDASILRGAALVRKNLPLFNKINKDMPDPSPSAAALVTPSRTRSAPSSTDKYRAHQKSLLDEALEEEEDDEFEEIWCDRERRRKEQQQQKQKQQKKKKKKKTIRAMSTHENNRDNNNNRTVEVVSEAPSFDEEIHWETMEFVGNLDSGTGYNNNRNVRHDQIGNQSETRVNQVKFRDNEVSSFASSPPRSRGSRDFSSSSPTPSDRTPETLMGRNKSIKCKMYTYHVQPTHEMGDSSYDDSGESCGVGSYEATVIPTSSSMPPLPIPIIDSEHEQEAIEDPLPSLLSPLTRAYMKLQKDAGYRHAQKAGYLWQSLVGQHVRFPKHWFDSLRAPPMGGNAPWQYVARHTIDSNPIFANLIRNRSAPGRLLLHLVVRDILKGIPVLDIAIGVFHPNARGIRSNERPDPHDEEARHVWMAVRKRSLNHVTVMDSLLLPPSSKVNDSPIGENRRGVTNVNMRAVFGEEPPIHTICISESELWEKLSAAAQAKPQAAHAPALLILQEFLVLH